MNPFSSRKTLLLAVILAAMTFSKSVRAQESFFSYDNRTYFEVDGRLGKYFPFEERHAYMKVLPQYGVDLRITALSCASRRTT